MVKNGITVKGVGAAAATARRGAVRHCGRRDGTVIP